MLDQLDLSSAPGVEQGNTSGIAGTAHADLLGHIAWVDNEHPAEWMFHRLPERVKPFKHHLVGANWSVDQKQDWRGFGFSVIISNEGKVVASAKSLYGSEIVYAELPTAK